MMDPDSLQRVSQGCIQRLISAPRRALYILIVNTLGSVGSLEPTLSNNPAFKDRSTLKHKKTWVHVLYLSGVTKLAAEFDHCWELSFSVKL